MEKICEVSNPELVLKQLKKYYGDDVELYFSTSKNKKYMVFDEDGKKLHFGDLRFSEYTKHQDKKRRENFRNRNKKWKDAEVYTCSFIVLFVMVTKTWVLLLL
jgi:hypothetical protein